MKPFSIAGLQLDLKAADNLELVVKKIRTTLIRFPWVQMVVLSELAVCGAGTGTAEPLPSPAEDRLSALAKELGIWLVTGSLYEKDGQDIFNTVSAISPEGAVVARYRKMYPFYPYEKGVAAGSEPCVFDVPGVGRFGLSICYDMWFPETSRALALMGAEVIIHPTLTNTIDRDVECAMVRATAAQQQCYMVDINGAGEQAVGRSVIAGPDGETVYAAGDTEEIIVVELDLERVSRSRENGVLKLGQPLKSFRDAAHDFPAPRDSAFLKSLGQLKVPERGA